MQSKHKQGKQKQAQAIKIKQKQARALDLIRFPGQMPYIPLEIKAAYHRQIDRITQGSDKSHQK